MFYSYNCTDSSSFHNVSHENSVKLRVLNTSSLKRFYAVIVTSVCKQLESLEIRVV